MHFTGKEIFPTVIFISKIFGPENFIKIWYQTMANGPKYPSDLAYKSVQTIYYCE